MQHYYPHLWELQNYIIKLYSSQTPNTQSLIDLNILQIVSPVYIPWLKAGDRDIETNKREVTSGLIEFIVVVA